MFLHLNVNRLCLAIDYNDDDSDPKIDVSRVMDGKRGVSRHSRRVPGRMVVKCP